jgi:effector-binding domain-containing protein
MNAAADCIQPVRAGMIPAGVATRPLMNRTCTAMNFPPDLAAPLLLGAFALFTSILHAQSPTPAAAAKPLDPAVAALLDKVAATRGIAANVKTRSAVQTGDYEVWFDGQKAPVAKGTFRDAFSGTDLARHVSDMGSFGTMEKGVHRDVVWELDPHMGAKVHRGVNAAAVQRYFAILRGDDPRTLYTQIVIAGTEPIDGRPHTALRMVTAEGQPDTWFDTWFVDAEHRVARIDTALPAPESTDAAFGMKDLMPARLTFAEWQTVDGGQFAMLRTLVMGPATVKFVGRKTEVGAPLAAETFAPPKAVANVKPEAVGPAFGPDGKPTYQVIERAAQPVASIRVKTKASEISAQLAVLLPEVATQLTAMGAKMAGPPFSRYHTMSRDEIDLEAGFPVHKPIEATGRIENSELPGGKLVTCWHIGAYEKLTAAHTGLMTHVTANKLKPRGGPWEIYWTDPGMVPDQAKWKTQLFQPIE